METQNNSTSGEQLTLANALNADATNPVETPVETTTEDTSNEVEVTEEQKLDMLKKKATLMGIQFSNNIKAETLLERINAKLEGEEAANAEQSPEPTPAPTPEATPTSNNDSLALGSQADKSVQAKAELTPREKLKREAMRLVRVRISNLDPKKKDLAGEIFTVANDVLGTVRLFVPYGEVTDDGWHIPNWVYKQLEKRRFLHIRVTKDRQTGREKVEHFMAKEFSLEVLNPLTQTELDTLARNQAAAGSIQRTDS